MADRSNNIGGQFYDPYLVQNIKVRSETMTLTGATTLAASVAGLLLIDPGGAARDVTLPAEATSKDLVIFIRNTADAAETITVKDDGAATIGTVAQNAGGMFHCDGTTWRKII